MAARAESAEPLPAATPVSLWRALDVIDDPWSWEIIKEAFLGTTRFQDFQERLGIPRQTLVLRLNRLTDAALFYKRPVQDYRLVYEYRLTPKGGDLYPVILAIWQWHHTWYFDPSELPERLYHVPCGEVFDPKLVCLGCGETPGPTTLSVRNTVGLGKVPAPSGRRARIANELGSKGEDRLAATVLGDGWSLMVLNAVMKGVGTYDALQAALHISSNVLSARLKTLVALELMVQERSIRDRRVYYYSATNKGTGVFPIILTLTQWGDRWLAGSDGPPQLFAHAPCESIAGFRTVCGHCGQRVRPDDVRQEALQR